MSADTSKLQAAAIRELCKPLRLPTIAAQAVRLAEQMASLPWWSLSRMIRGAAHTFRRPPFLAHSPRAGKAA